MNATWMLGLYPTEWRARHEPVFRAKLDAEPASFADLLDIGLGAVNAHLHLSRSNPGPDARPAPSRRHHHPSQGWMQLLFIHGGLFITINVILAAINLLTNASNLWFPYALWGTGMVLTAHLGLTYPGRDYLRAHAMLATVVSTGLIGIDRAGGGNAWALWPIWAMASLLLVHALRSSGTINDFGAHALIIVLGGLELLAVNIQAPDAMPDLIWVLGYVLVTLLAHALLTYGRMRLLPVHAVTFVLLNTMFFIDSMNDGGHWWFHYPLVATSLLLTAHILVETRGLSLLASGRFATLAAADPTLPVNVPKMSPVSGDAIAASRRFRGFLIHVGLFAMAFVELAALNLLSPDGGLWMIWPLGVWLVLLSAHAGTFVTPGHPVLGLHAFGGGAIASGLIAIDATTDGGPWAFWPIIGWLVLLAIHAGVSSAPGGVGERSLFRAHLAGTVAAIAALLALVATGSGGSWIVWPIWGLLIALGAHTGLVILPRKPILGIWIATGGMIMIGLAAIDRVTEGVAWAFWPGIVWVLGSIVIFGLTIDLNQVISSASGSASSSDARSNHHHDRGTAPE